MTLINTAAYNQNDLYRSSNENRVDSPIGSVDKKSTPEPTSSALTQDTVTLSTEVAIARTREIIGLNPTGRLTLSDFETAAKDQKQIVTSSLASFMDSLGIDDNQKISLSLDNKSKITIEEKFPGKKELEKKLNEDKSFLLAFNSLSANNEFLDYATSFKTSSTNLLSAMNSESDWDDMLSLASKYKEIKSSTNPLATLLSLGKTQEPYTFTHDPEGDAAKKNILHPS